ncbi:hypothetical protein COLO4_04508 [Corchorus olitorius]|uniref:Transmembrane protein n=1 Tax=Corchorus olitorius TaxID=93759 RepID=A0A1R3KTL3_9ROSI|nr:hypothetical protein COLO4_04508 [Corchorus olitorius]
MIRFMTRSTRLQLPPRIQRDSHLDPVLWVSGSTAPSRHASSAALLSLFRSAVCFLTTFPFLCFPLFTSAVFPSEPWFFEFSASATLVLPGLFVPPFLGLVVMSISLGLPLVLV